ncbi:hypothetical protein AwWohl_10830 [Gammaproteobacteria bacterium]|nr:hypothetical protein AwWohl_10830 [Gammaproteobacteria bacterium]
MNHIIKAFAVSFILIFSISINILKAEPININTATAAEITKNLRGIGPAKAAAIVLFREKNGEFSKPEDLLNISGIGAKTLENIKPDLIFNETPDPDPKK